MSFDRLMERSGLDPDGPHTVLLMDFDDLNFEHVIGLDLIDVVVEAGKVEPDVFEHRKLNLLYFTGLLLMRLREPGMDQVRTMDFMTRLQRKLPLRRARQD